MVTYLIPANLADTYRGRRVVIRAPDPRALRAALSREDIHNVVYAQLPFPVGGWVPLPNWARGLPLDLVLERPGETYPSLYDCSRLAADHPVRVTIPVVPGFDKALLLAVALNFAVKLEVGRPDSTLIDTMLDLLDHYLHRTGVSEPVEFFHSVFLGFLHEEPVSLWAVQEEDPALFRQVTDEGEERLAGRLANGKFDAAPESALERLQSHLISDGAECATCPFFACCGGFFKWPEPAYSCAGVKRVLGTLRAAARELSADLAAAETHRGADRT
jgi:hypothetical protein